LTRNPDYQLPDPILASSTELSDFLADVEHRAFKQAVFAVRDRDSALDLVQDAMLRLSSKYGDHPASEFPMLFQRILQNAIRDWYRRQKVRSAWGVLLSSLSTNRDDEDFDPLESMDLTGKAPMPELPLARMERQQVIETIQKEVEKLGRCPDRSRNGLLGRQR
jgi:RNA polymerase sigma-70 factor (ECF subfamily)